MATERGESLHLLLASKLERVACAHETRRSASLAVNLHPTKGQPAGVHSNPSGLRKPTLTRPTTKKRQTNIRIRWLWYTLGRT